jgi:hypothetical protein
MSMTSLKAPVQASGQPVQCRLWERPSSARKASRKSTLCGCPWPILRSRWTRRVEIRCMHDESCAADDERHDHGVRCHEEWCVNAVWESWPMRERIMCVCIGGHKAPIQCHAATERRRNSLDAFEQITI